jgi:hypothetical protein
VATWREGLFVLAGEALDQELRNQSIRALAPDGRGGALAIVNGRCSTGMVGCHVAPRSAGIPRSIAKVHVGCVHPDIGRLVNRMISFPARESGQRARGAVR